MPGGAAIQNQHKSLKEFLTGLNCRGGGASTKIGTFGDELPGGGKARATERGRSPHQRLFFVAGH